MNHRPPLVLASTSPTRRSLLDAAGLIYEARAPDFEEIIPPHLSPEEAARALALGKARAARREGEDAIVIGADQVLDLGGAALGKPRDEADARAQLRRMSGRDHHLRTAVALLWPGGEKTFVASTRLKVRPLSDAEISAYIATGEWRGCAGGYRLEGRGVLLFEEIDGDYFNVLGLPLLPLLAALRELGAALPL
jgi:septum formation protein